MNKKLKCKIKNAILKTISTIAFVSAFVSVSALDSLSFIPCIVLIVSIAWIGLFCYVNRFMEV